VVTELAATSVTFTNVGDAPAGRFVVSVGGTAFTVEDGLAPGASARLDFKCRQGSFAAAADSTDRIEESDETNNARTAGPFDCQSPSPSGSPSPTVTPSPTQTTPPPELPDLVVRSISSDRVRVANMGSGSAGGFVVDVGPAGTFSIGGLAAGRSATVTFPCTDGTFTATADASGRVVESNERNNSRSGGPFQCLPDLIVSSLGLDSVTVANIGRGDAGPSIVTAGGQALSVPALGVGEEVQLTYQCVGGNVTAFADAQQQVAESNEGNNQRSAAVGQCGVP
jgi:subtilase family serine protease